MHPSSMHVMEKILSTLDKSRPLRVLDVGSMQIAEDDCYRDLLAGSRWDYVGMDLEPGKNVDCVAPEPYSWPFKEDSFDVVISGQCIEHTQNLHAWFRELARVLKPGGLTGIIVPWNFNIHRHPVDCWRILPDGMTYLLTEVAGLQTLRVFTTDMRFGDIGVQRQAGDDRQSKLCDLVMETDPQLAESLKTMVYQGDCVGIAVKPLAS